MPKTNIQKAASIMGKVGGKKRSEKLSQEQRSAIAKKGGLAKARNRKKNLKK